MQNSSDIDALVRTYAEGFSNSLEVSVKDLPNLASMLSGVVPELLSYLVREEIADYACRTQKEFGIESEDTFLFTIEKISYIIEIADDKRTERTLLVTLRSLSPQRGKLANFCFIPVDAQSPYSRFGFRLDSSLETLNEELTFIITKSLESFSRWFGGFIRSIILSGRNQVVDVLYSHVRSLFSEKIADQIYLYALMKRKGVYIFDSLSLENAIRAMNRGVKGLNTTPLQLINALAFKQLPFEELAAAVAIPEDKTVQLSKSEVEIKGHKKAGGMGLPELALYATEDLVIQPLVIKGKLLLEAAYHPTIREQVEMTLKRERMNFTSILNNHCYKFPLKTKSSALQLSKGAAEVWGTFWGAAWGVYSKIPQS